MDNERYNKYANIMARAIVLGIKNNINRGGGFPATDFGLFVPRFAGQSKKEA